MDAIAPMDRDSRNAMSAMVQDYLNGALSPEALLTRLYELGAETVDPLAREVPIMIEQWDCELGDVTDLTKRDWDFFQRLLLLQQTDAQLLPDEEEIATSRFFACLKFCVAVLLGIAGIATVGVLWRCIHWLVSVSTPSRQQ